MFVVATLDNPSNEVTYESPLIPNQRSLLAPQQLGVAICRM